MIRSLIMLLHFSIDKMDETITLEQELQLLESYINIQKMKYGDIFDLIIKAQEEHKNVMLPKLILQPIVENSIFHGFASKTDRGEIIIETVTLKDTFRLYVRDNGHGMDEKEIDRILHQQEDESSGNPHKKVRLSSIGIQNVNERIKLLFGVEYGLHIQSTRGLGTCVEIILPSSV